MVRITEGLVRSRAEHNEMEIGTLEELSLHQQDIERIENLDKWCRQLKILYLQSNLISKIENVGRLKQLEYLNLALNNVERIENLEKCESLKKLDLTANFVGELTSIECLRDLIHFEELYLTGNPCTDFEGYRQFVIGTLPRLRSLDGQEILQSDRILASQALPFIRPAIVEQQRTYQRKREREKLDYEMKNRGETVKNYSSGSDWYTKTDDGSAGPIVEVTDDTNETTTTNNDEYDYWKQSCPYTPETRIEMHQHRQEMKAKDAEMQKNKDPSRPEKRPRSLFASDGRPVNVNEPKIDFELSDEDDRLILDVAVYRHLDTSLLDVDIQPKFVRVTIKGKVLQLVLPDEVICDKSSAKRSQTTGHLVVEMAKMNPIVRPSKAVGQPSKAVGQPALADRSAPEKGPADPPATTTKRQFLEVDEKAKTVAKLDEIVGSSKRKDDGALKSGPAVGRPKPVERANSADFVDDPSVPPLI